MWELDYKEGWALKNWCFWNVVLEKTLENPLDCKEIKPVNPKGNQSWIFFGRTDAEAKLQYFGYLMWRTDSLEKTLMLVLQKGGYLPGPKTGLLSNTQKWIVWEDTCADKARDFIGKGHLGAEQVGKGTQENCSAVWLTVLRFMVMGLVSRWSLANHSNSESFWWCMHRSAKMDASKRDSGKWTDRQCLLLTFPKLFQLVVTY